MSALEEISPDSRDQRLPKMRNHNKTRMDIALTRLLKQSLQSLIGILRMKRRPRDVSIGGAMLGILKESTPSCSASGTAGFFSST